MTNRLHVKIATIVAILTTFLTTFSCKKEYVDKFNIISGDTITLAGYTHIEGFYVKEFSMDTILKASILNDTITVYWPSYKPLPVTIRPKILLPDSSSISPGNNEEVPFKTGTKYIVTSGVNTFREYYLKVSLQQPRPWYYAEFTTNPFENTSLQTLGRGDNFLPDTAQTKIILVSTVDGKEYATTVTSVTLTDAQFLIPLHVPAGTYDLKVMNGIYTILNEHEASRNHITVAYPTRPNVYNVGLPASINAGDTLIVRGTLLEKTTNATLISGTDFSGQALQIVSKSMDSITLSIPPDFKPDNYITLELITDGIISACTIKLEVKVKN